MVKELTKKLIVEYIKNTAENLKRIEVNLGKNKNIVKEILGREQLYRQKRLPIEISDIIEKEVLKSTKFLEAEKWQLMFEQQKEEYTKILVWLIRLLRNEIIINANQPKKGLIWKTFEKNIIEIEQQENKSEHELEKWNKKKEGWNQQRQENQKALEEMERRQQEWEKQEKERLEKEKYEQINQQFRKAKGIYNQLPQEAKDWVKTIFWIVVICVSLGGGKYIIRGLKYVFRFIKWTWNSIIAIFTETKNLFGKEKGEKSTPNEEEEETPTTNEKKENKKLENQDENSKKKGKNRRKRKKDK